MQYPFKITDITFGNGSNSTVAGNAVTFNGQNTFTGGISSQTNGPVTIGGSGYLGSGNYSGTIAMGTGTLFYSSSANQTLGGVISGTSGKLTKDTSTTSTLTLTAANTYTGDTTINAGTLDVSGGRLYAGASNTSAVVTVNTGGKLVVSNLAQDTANGSLGGLSTAAARLVINGGTLVINQTNVQGRAVTIGANGGTLEVNTSGYVMNYVLAAPNVYTDNSALTLSGSGSATMGKAVTGAGVSLVKDGAGTWVLDNTATHTYTGNTTVTDGTLIVKGNISTSVLTTVQSGATLGGSGTTGALTVENGGTLAPGNSPGVLTASGTTTLNTGSIFAWTIDSDAVSTARGTEYAGLNTTSVSGSGAVFQIVTADSQGFADDFWTTNHNWTDIFKSADGSTSLGNDWSTVFTSFAYSDGTNPITNVATYGSFSWTSSGSTLTWTPIPEPTSALAGLLLGAGLLRRRRSA